MESEQPEIVLEIGVDFSKPPSKKQPPPSALIAKLTALANRTERGEGVLIIKGQSAATPDVIGAWVLGLQKGVLNNQVVPTDLKTFRFVVVPSDSSVRVAVQRSGFPVFASFCAFHRPTSESQAMTTTTYILGQLARKVDESAALPVPASPLNIGTKVNFHESEVIEFKSGKGKLPALVSRMGLYASSFLNEEGGILYWGIDDDCTVSGLSVDEEEVRRRVTEKLALMYPPVELGPTGHCDITFIPLSGDKKVVALRFKARNGITWLKRPTFYTLRDGRETLDQQVWEAQLSSLPSQVVAPVTAFAQMSIAEESPAVPSPGESPTNNAPAAWDASRLTNEIRALLQERPGLDNTTIIRELRKKGFHGEKREVNKILNSNSSFVHTPKGQYKHWSLKPV